MAHSEIEAEVLVVGGGISGLTVAWLLARQGRDVAVIEAAGRPGGTIGSAREDGCLVESGPNSTLETSPLIGALIEQAGLAGQKIYASPAAKNRFVLRGGVPIALPLTPPAFLATRLFTWRAKLALLREPGPVPRSRRRSPGSSAAGSARSSWTTRSIPSSPGSTRATRSGSASARPSLALRRSSSATAA